MTDQLPRNGHTHHTVGVGSVGEPAHPHASHKPDHPGQLDTPHAYRHDAHDGRGGHRWMMVVCCIPMLIVVGALVATGVAGAGAIIFAAVCLGMMWLMMKTMPGGH